MGSKPYKWMITTVWEPVTSTRDLQVVGNITAICLALLGPGALGAILPASSTTKKGSIATVPYTSNICRDDRLATQSGFYKDSYNPSGWREPSGGSTVGFDPPMGRSCSELREANQIWSPGYSLP